MFTTERVLHVKRDRKIKIFLNHQKEPFQEKLSLSFPKIVITWTTVIIFPWQPQPITNLHFQLRNGK